MICSSFRAWTRIADSSPRRSMKRSLLLIKPINLRPKLPTNRNMRTLFQRTRAAYCHLSVQLTLKAKMHRLVRGRMHKTPQRRMVKRLRALVGKLVNLARKEAVPTKRWLLRRNKMHRSKNDENKEIKTQIGSSWFVYSRLVCWALSIFSMQDCLIKYAISSH